LYDTSEEEEEMDDDDDDGEDIFDQKPRAKEPAAIIDMLDSSDESDI
jgi:hypothetical protein